MGLRISRLGHSPSVSQEDGVALAAQAWMEATSELKRRESAAATGRSHGRQIHAAANIKQTPSATQADSLMRTALLYNRLVRFLSEGQESTNVAREASFDEAKAQHQ